jgi:hypothetical protein
VPRLILARAGAATSGLSPLYGAPARFYGSRSIPGDRPLRPRLGDLQPAGERRPRPIVNDAQDQDLERAGLKPRPRSLQPALCSQPGEDATLMIAATLPDAEPGQRAADGPAASLLVVGSEGAGGVIALLVDEAVGEQAVESCLDAPVLGPMAASPLRDLCRGGG